MFRVFIVGQETSAVINFIKGNTKVTNDFKWLNC